MKSRIRCVSFLGALLAATGCMISAPVWGDDQVNQQPAAGQGQAQVPTEAVAVLMSTDGSKVSGTLVLTQEGETVRIKGQVKNLSPGKHGFHIHQYGDLRSTDGKAAGGHYEGSGKQHGSPDDDNHHAGDFGNIVASDDGVATVDKISKELKLHFVIGRSIVVHKDADDLKSQPSGNAGPRVAVGVIGFANVGGNDG